MKIRAGYALLTLAFIVSFLGLIPLFHTTAAGSLNFWVVVAVSLATIALLLPREWARDRYAASMFIVAMLSLPLFAAGAVVVLFTGAGRYKAIALVAIISVVLVFVVRALWQERHLKDRLPQWLSTKFPRQMIFEDDGVQWTIDASGANVAQGVNILVYLQNNIDAERQVTIRLRDEHGLLLRSGAVTIPALRPETLPPRAHAVVTIPVDARNEERMENIRVYVTVDARGPSGARNRGWRAPPGPRPMSKWLVVLGPLAGVWVWPWQRDRTTTRSVLEPLVDIVVGSRGGVFVTLRSSGGPRVRDQGESVRWEPVPLTPSRT